ncbi:MAG TPA: zinc-binding dehydrogenase [Streptosporangiaceae bacterium]|jgi:NADPH2:quinone reductase|nr:zinc-binding dehydrogenase [Streptosporangiaceae bacterium]HEX2821158.1 zinc-binding dehydrogenase [Streptosporangiaceae bacterium]
MRIVQVTEFGGPEVLAVSEAPEPSAGPGQVVVDVLVAPVLFLDTQIRSGSARDWFATTLPYVPGAGVAGEVASVGEGVDPDWVGRRVVASTAERGGYLERAVVAVDDLIAVPVGLGIAEAAALLHDGRTAVSLIDQADLRAEEWVLILGAGGGLGSLLIQLAHNAGARVIGAARGKEKLNLAQELGADAVVDYSESGWPEQILAVTGGAGPSTVFDGVGGEIGKAAFAITALGGRFSAHGAPSGGFAQIDRQKAERRDITVRGIEHVQFAPLDAKALTERAMSKAVAKQIRPIIGQTFPLKRAADAHRAIEARDVIGKTLLVI